MHLYTKSHCKRHNTDAKQYCEYWLCDNSPVFHVHFLQINLYCVAGVIYGRHTHTLWLFPQFYYRRCCNFSCRVTPAIIELAWGVIDCISMTCSLLWQRYTAARICNQYTESNRWQRACNNPHHTCIITEKNITFQWLETALLVLTMCYSSMNRRLGYSTAQENLGLSQEMFYIALEKLYLSLNRNT